MLLSSSIFEGSPTLRFASLTTAGKRLISSGISSSADSAITRLSCMYRSLLPTVYWLAPRESGVRRKRRPKAEAGEVVQELLEKAVSTAGRDLKLAGEQAELA